MKTTPTPPTLRVPIMPTPSPKLRAYLAGYRAYEGGQWDTYDATYEAYSLDELRDMLERAESTAADAVQYRGLSESLDEQAAETGYPDEFYQGFADAVHEEFIDWIRYRIRRLETE